MAMTKFEKVQRYLERNGVRLEKRKDRYGKMWYHAIATKKIGYIKPGQEICSPAATLGPFERMQQHRFLGR